MEEENISSIISTSNFAFKSYKEYVQQLAIIQPEYQWLSSFLSFEGSFPLETAVAIMDSVDGKFKAEEFIGDSKSHLREALQARSPDVVTRLVIVSYLQVWSIDRSVVTTIGETFGVDPVFFWQTFDHFYAKNDRQCPPEMKDRDGHGTLWTFPLPSELKSLDVCFIDEGLNALLLSSPSHTADSSKMKIDKNPDTVIVFLRDPMSCKAGFTKESRPTPTELARAIENNTVAGYSQRTLASRYIASLHRMSPSAISSADKRPVEYMDSYIHLMAVEVFARLQRQSFLLEQQYYNGESAQAQAEALEEGWAIVHDTRLYMTNSQNSIKKSISASSAQGADILHDYEVLMDQIRLIQDDLRDYVSRHLGMMTLEDSKKSIEQAVTVNRLTKLAFIFLPLNFVTSVFGMNIIELGTGKAELWIFFVVAVTLGAVMFAIVVIALLDSRKALRGYVRPDRNASRLRTSFTLARRSLKEAGWLLIFFIGNSKEDGKSFCRAINRNPFSEWSERDHNDYPQRQPRFEFPNFPKLTDNEFWKEHAREMNMLITGRKD